MTKIELIAALAEDGVVTQKQVAATLEGLASLITLVLQEGEAIKLPGIGTLEPIETGPRTGRNPRTGEEINLPARTRVAFRASATLKNALNP